MTSLQKYLSSIKECIAGTRLVVCGNEAADLDSMVSSVAYAFVLAQTYPEKKVIPVIRISRADLALRPEIGYLFFEAGMNIEHLVFSDDVNLDNILLHADLVLVDHNRLGGELHQYSTKVLAILDHHKDEGFYMDAAPRKIETVGSTATLVAREFNDFGVAVEQDMAMLLGGTLLLDTVNLSTSAGRVTQLDIEVAEKILPLCPMPADELFKRLQGRQADTHGLSTSDLLRKDYKEYQAGSVKYGVASVKLSIKKWQKRDEDLVAKFFTFSADRNLDLLIAMSSYNNPDFHRELIVFWPAKKGHKKRLLKYLESQDLELTPFACVEAIEGNNKNITFYSQGNRQVSRKILQPLLDDFFIHDRFY